MPYCVFKIIHIIVFAHHNPLYSILILLQLPPLGYINITAYVNQPVNLQEVKNKAIGSIFTYGSKQTSTHFFTNFTDFLCALSDCHRSLESKHSKT